MADGKFRISPEGEITVIRQMDGEKLLDFYQQVNVVAASLLSNAAEKALEENSVDVVKERLDDLDEGTMYLNMAQDGKERSFTEWWDSEDGEYCIKGVGIGLVVGISIVSVYYASAMALGAATGLSGEITYASRMVAATEGNLARITEAYLGVPDAASKWGWIGRTSYESLQLSKYTAALVKAKATLASMATFATGLVTATAGAVVKLGMTSEDGQIDIATCNSRLCEIVDPFAGAMM